MPDRDHKTPACFCDRLALRDRAKAENIGQISGIQRGHADGPLLRPPSVKSAYQRLVADSGNVAVYHLKEPGSWADVYDDLREDSLLQQVLQTVIPEEGSRDQIRDQVWEWSADCAGIPNALYKNDKVHILGIVWAAELPSSMPVLRRCAGACSRLGQSCFDRRKSV